MTPSTPRLVRSFLTKEMIEVLKWPAQSPDINPCKCYYFGNSLNNQNNTLKNFYCLFNSKYSQPCLIFQLWGTRFYKSGKIRQVGKLDGNQ